MRAVVSDTTLPTRFTERAVDYDGPWYRSNVVGDDGNHAVVRDRHGTVIFDCGPDRVVGCMEGIRRADEIVHRQALWLAAKETTALSVHP